MTIQLLQWGLFSFMLGLILSLPLAAVHYQNSPSWTKLFTNPRKLKSAHLDFFTQAFAAALVYLLESALQTAFPLYIIIPLLFGTICNPLLLLIEATPLNRSGLGKRMYLLLRATSPVSLLLAWFFIGWCFLPLYMILLLTLIALTGWMVIMKYKAA
ncbi:hypothetical protein RAC89_24665 [Paenibacillus sp. GD4]|uniref:hypothetical protein n=1 Tax=Paenibacillus sp. GD4 TaxID=3068890 RepID=UPI002796A53B|nr:hypothetical protein [Paenibacillus sp. GD4]MDQ1913597.1 hypothetical protein [Paenibacillus sp. GD4]